MTRSEEGGVRVKNGFHVEGIHQSVSGELHVDIALRKVFCLD
jgi:hypothetical protein